MTFGSKSVNKAIKSVPGRRPSTGRNLPQYSKRVTKEKDVAMIECPHCREKAMTKFRKSFLGPAQSASCKRCGKLVSVPFTAMLAVIPFLLSIIVASLFASSSWVVAASLIGGFASMTYIHVFIFPLVPRDT